MMCCRLMGNIIIKEEKKAESYRCRGRTLNAAATATPAAATSTEYMYA